VSDISQKNVSTLQPIKVKNRQQTKLFNGSRIKTDSSTSQNKTEETNARTRSLSLPFPAEADDSVRGSASLSGDPTFLSSGSSAFLSTGGSTALGDGGSAFLFAGDSGVLGDRGPTGLSGDGSPLVFF
jgi:hypothetical protein